MKQLEELEEKFLEEIKPLVYDFIEIRKQELDIQKRMKCVDIRKKVESKTREFIKTYRESEEYIKLSAEIEKREKENAQLAKKRIELFEAVIGIRNRVMEIDKAIEETQNEGEEYQLLCEAEIEESQKYYKIRQEYNILLEEYTDKIKQTDELKIELTNFEEKYGDMEYITEREMYSLDDFIGLKEEQEKVRMVDSQIYDENGKIVNNIEVIMAMQNRAEKEEAQRFEKIKKEIANQVLEEKKKEYAEYIEKAIEKLRESIDKELREMEEENDREVNMKQDKQNRNTHKRGKISGLWQKITSIFGRRNIPRLEKAKKEEVEPNKKMEYLKIGIPTQKEQKECTDNFLEKSVEKSIKEKNDFDNLLTILD